MTENDKKLKILYLVTLSELGGAQRYILDLATNLGGQFEITVAAGGNGKLFEQLKKNQISAVRLKNLTREINLGQDLPALFEIYQLIKKVKPDILHLNSSKAGALGAIAGKLAGVKKIIYTVHGFVFNEPMPGWKKNLYTWIEKISAKLKTTLICVSEFDRQQGLSHKIALAEKLVTIHNGIGIDSLKLLSKEEAKNKLITNYQLPITNYPTIGTIANFYPTKGLQYFIQAAKQIIQHHPDAQFIVIGDGKLRPALEAEIKKFRLEKNFQLLGAIDNAAKLLPAFDVYVCSSIKEGLPYSILEAMAAGVPIVAVAVGGIPEMINDQSGVLVDSKNADNLAAAILKLLENKKMAKDLAETAYKKVCSEFLLEKMVEKTIKIYS